MVRQLLTSARKTEPRLEPVDVNGLIVELRNLLKQIFPKTIELSLNVSDIPLVMADANQVNQLLLNLCVNARDAMPQGGNLLLKTEIISGAELRERFEEAREQRYVRAAKASCPSHNRLRLGD